MLVLGGRLRLYHLDSCDPAGMFRDYKDKLAAFVLITWAQVKEDRVLADAKNPVLKLLLIENAYGSHLPHSWQLLPFQCTTSFTHWKGSSWWILQLWRNWRPSSRQFLHVWLYFTFWKLCGMPGVSFQTAHSFNLCLFYFHQHCSYHHAVLIRVTGLIIAATGN